MADGFHFCFEFSQEKKKNEFPLHPLFFNPLRSVKKKLKDVFCFGLTRENGIYEDKQVIEHKT